MSDETPDAVRLAPGPGASNRSVAYLLQVFPKYSETFILNELLEHQRQGSPMPVLALRAPREGRFHGYLANLELAAQYVPESVWDQPGKVREAVWGALRTAPAGLSRAGRRWLGRHVTLRDVWQAVMVRRWALRRKVAHVHCHFCGFAAHVAFLSRLMGGPSYSVTLHAHEVFRDSGDKDLLRDVVNHSAFCVTVSHYNARHLVDRIGVDPQTVRVLYNGISLERFAYHDGPREPLTILAVGRLIEKKGFIHLVRACRLLRDGGLAVQCDIVGEGREQDVPAREIRRLDLGDAVRLAGPWSQEKVVEELRRRAAFALPCVVAADGNMDALPTVILEAMASGCPVVSARLSGIPEMVADGESGLLVPPGDEPALAAALARVLTDSKLASRFAAQGRTRVEARFDVRKSVRTLAGWLHEAAARSAPAAARSRAAPWPAAVPAEEPAA